MKTAAFYDQYHQKNDKFSRVIGDTNATYFYIQQTLRQACELLTKNKSQNNNWTSINVLDVGCGVGALSLYLASKGATVTGIDISPRAIAIASNAARQTALTAKVQFKTGTLSLAKKGTYDLVLCSEVIEHIANDHTFLTRLASQLKPGGILMLTTPSSDNLLYNLGYYDSFDHQVGHERRYTARSLLQLLATTELQPILLRQVEGPLRNILFTSKLGMLVKFIRGPLVPFFHWFDQLSTYLFGAADLQLLAQKPAKALQKALQ